MLGIDRQSIINTMYGALAEGAKPLNSAIYYQTQAAYQPYFQKWDYNQAKAFALLKNHCTGGPASRIATSPRCGRAPATRPSSGSPGRRRTDSDHAGCDHPGPAQGDRDQARRPRAANVFFGQTISPGDYDIADFAWVTATRRLFSIWSCGGDQNYLHYCSKKATDLMEDGDGPSSTRPSGRPFHQADKLMSRTCRSIPLYQRPSSARVQVGICWACSTTRRTSGPFWNIEDWHWKS